MKQNARRAQGGPPGIFTDKGRVPNMNTSGKKLIIVLVACVGLSVGAGRMVAAGTFLSDTNSAIVSAAGPQIKFDSTVLDFGVATAGRVIEHNFVFTNTGDQTLEIKDVRPTCGCTVAGAWDSRVEPGKFGTIPIRFTPTENSREIFKTVIVLCNDPSQTNVILQIIGKIWEPIDVTPAIVRFSASSDCHTNQTKVVRIVNNLNQPLVLSEPECGDQAFKTLLKTVRPGKEFELQITMVPPLKPGSVTVPITLKTSSTNLPVIYIAAFATVQATVMATPPQITLAPGPLPSGVESKVTILNNRAKPLVLAEPTVNIVGVEVHLQEVQPGHQFFLTARFPAAFKISPGQSVRVQVKTSDPQFPVITVPVFQNRHLTEMLSTSESDQPSQKQ